ncbi:MAG: hypothetical protein ACOCWD_05285 [Tangfeifania sp.]
MKTKAEIKKYNLSVIEEFTKKAAGDVAGLFEKDREDKIYNTYVCVDKNGLVARYRKLHPFIHPELSP